MIENAAAIAGSQPTIVAPAVAIENVSIASLCVIVIVVASPLA